QEPPERLDDLGRRGVGGHDLDRAVRLRHRAEDLRQRNVVVLADALQNQEDGRTLAAVGDEMRPAFAHRVRLAGPEAHFLLRIAQEQAQAALQDVERVLDLVVIVPGHLLARADLELRDSKARTLGMPGPALDLVEMTRVPHPFAFDGFHGARLPFAAMVPSAATPSPRGDRANGPGSAGSRQGWSRRAHVESSRPAQRHVRADAERDAGGAPTARRRL